MSRYFGLGVRGRGANLGGVQVTGTPIPNLRTESEETETTPSTSGFSSQLSDEFKRKIDVDSAAIQDHPGIKRFGTTIRKETQRIVEQARQLSRTPFTGGDQYETDILDVSRNTVINGSFVPIEKDGISSYRPEIISVFDFLSAFNDQSFTNLGNLIDFQYRSSKIREQSLFYIFEQLEKTRNGRQNLNSVKNSYNQRLNNIKESIRIYNQILTSIDTVKNALDVKKYPSTLFDTNKFKTLKDYFTSYLQFTEDNWNQFSETKIFLQLIFDLRNTLENYSYNLFDIVDTDRASNFSPVTLDTTFDLSNGFTFNVNSIRSPSDPLNAAETSFFSQFMSGLPTNPDDRIKILVNLLSKELRVSKGLGTSQIQTDLLRDFGQGNEGNPFDNILGTVNNTIFDPVAGVGSLASNYRIDVTEDIVVLPFENKYIDFESTKQTYIPGSQYLAETIVENPTPTLGFNTAPFTTFVQQYVKRSSSVRGAITKLLQLDQQISSGLVPENLFDMIGSLFRSSIEGTTNKNSLNSDQLIINSLFKLANTDTTLKNMLFQFCILAALDASKEEDQRSSVQNFITDLRRTFTSLNFVRLEPGEDPFIADRTVEFSELMRRLANDIEARAKTLTNSSQRREFNRTLQVVQINQDIRNQVSGLKLNVPTSILGFTGNGNVLNISNGDIASVLVESMEASAAASTNLIRSIIDLYTSTFRLASDITNPVHLLNDLSHRTRFNFLSSTTVFLIGFEIFSSLVEKYSFQSFSRTPTTTGFKIEHTAEMNGLIVGAFENIIQTKVSSTPKASLIGYVPLNVLSGQLRGTTIPKLIPNRIFQGSGFSIVNSSTPDATSNTAASNALNASTIPSNVLVDALGSGLAGTNVKSLSDFTNILDVFQRVGANANFYKEIGLRPDLFRGFEYFISLRGIRRKLAAENLIIDNALHIFEKVESRLNEGVSKINSNLTTNLIQQFLNLGNQEEDLTLIKSRTQIDTMESIYDNFLSMTTKVKNKKTKNLQSQNGNFVIYDGFERSSYNALLSFLSQKQLKNVVTERSKFKVVSVGLPQGLSNQISDRISAESITRTSFLDKEFDVISINIYKRDLRREELVFKPKKHLFDLSLYSDPTFLLEEDGRLYDFERLLETITLKDFSKNTNPKINLRELQNSTNYEFLQPFELRNMFSNHVQSNLLNQYVKITSGIELSEKNFTYKPLYEYETEFNPDLVNLVLEYIKNDLKINLPSNDINDLLINERVPADIRDMLQLVAFGNVLSKPSYVQELVISPKKFDRVFNILLDVQDFEIDVEATKLTEAGRQLLNKQSFLSLIDEALYETQGIMKIKQNEELKFDDFFVVVETLRGV